MARQYNFGIRASRATLVAIVDDQGAYAPDWLSNSVHDLRANPQAALLLVDEGMADRPVATFQKVGRFARADVASRSVLLRRRAFLEMGAFDELLGEKAESRPAMMADIAVRALLAGYEVGATCRQGVTTGEPIATDPDPARWYDLGIMCAKPLKSHSLAALPLMFHYLFVRSLRTGKRWTPFRLANFRAFMRGYMAGLENPLRQDALCYLYPAGNMTQVRNVATQVSANLPSSNF